MTETTPERVRPCLKCGSLQAFAAGRCPECGAALPEVDQAVERVEACTSCGTIVGFGCSECPECGASVRLPFDPDGDRVKTCVSCEGLVPYSDVYCLMCGNLTVELETPEIPLRVAEDVSARPLETLTDGVSMTAAAFGALTMLLALGLLLR